jgi:hypothetical protein
MTPMAKVTSTNEKEVLKREISFIFYKL